MIRLLIVHLRAELEGALAEGRTDPADTEQSWRRLGENLVTAVCVLSSALHENSCQEATPRAAGSPPGV
ncbi:hypothetical protein ACQP1V_06365 [Microtetraspora malaysiensis]|uniref:hypothetical protein n=1 Tax=Microtetraspora malaysiensis TaxID=161358 RepID=UPI003D8CAA7F